MGLDTGSHLVLDWRTPVCVLVAVGEPEWFRRNHPEFRYYWSGAYELPIVSIALSVTGRS